MPYSCRQCEAAGLRERRNCEGSYRPVRDPDELEDPQEVAFLGAVPSKLWTFRHVWRSACPVSRLHGGLTPAQITWLSAARAYRAHGHLPFRGGTLEQPAVAMDLVEALAGEYGRIEEARRQVEEARRRAREAARAAQGGRR